MDETLAHSKQRLSARDFHHGKQRFSPFYHDLDLDLVGLVGNLFDCRAASPSGCRATSEPNSSLLFSLMCHFNVGTLTVFR